MSDTLVNRVAESGLITLRPEDWAPKTVPSSLDLKDFLFMQLILREKEFREMLKTHEWSQYKDQPLCVYCSVDALIPNWAYMLITSHASPFCKEIFFGTTEQWISSHLLHSIDTMDTASLKDCSVVIKGCSDTFSIGPEVYMALTQKLIPVVRSLMFGEPCSTVPVYKRPKAS